jgi:DNA-binding winged helix-turn-helix (wHTH) protein/tetratricopeptide (TPR) repeat protein
MSHPVYHFGDCRVDPLARELHRDGTLLALSPKVFDCLVYLIEHRDRAVGRDELIAAVWGKADVSDTLLGQTLLKARRAVGDDGNEQNAIRTIPRFGYRWVRELTASPVAPAETPGLAIDDSAAARPGTTTAPPAAPVESSPAAATRRRRAWRLPVALVGAFALLIALAAIDWQRMHAPVGTAGVAADALVVLPASVESGEEWAWLRLGLMDLVASRLRQAGQTVAPSDTVVAAWRAASSDAGPGADPATRVGALTGARKIVIPRVSRRADDWLVEMELRAGDDTPQRVRSQGRDPIETARAASDRLLLLLGATLPAHHAEAASSLSLDELDQRVQAALLGDDFSAARGMIESAPAALRDSPTMRVRLAQIDYRVGRLAAVRSNLEQVLKRVSAQDDPVLRARALHMLGAITVREDRSADAIPIFGEVIHLTESAREPGVLGQAYTGLAAALINLARYDEAANALAHARIALALANDTLALARVDANEGILDNNRGRHAEALPVLQRAAVRFRQFGALNDLAMTLTAQMKAELGLLDAKAALATGESLLPQRGLVANPRSRGNFDLQRANALAANGRLREARALIAELMRDPALANEAELPGSIATADARLQLAAGDAGAAAESALRATSTLPTTDEAHVRAQAWLLLVRALRATGRIDAAREQSTQFTAWSRTRDDMPGVTLFAALAAAEQARSEHRNDEADAAFATALADAERWGVPRDIVVVAASYGNSLLADEQPDRASAVIGRVARWAEQDFDCAMLQARLYAALGQSEAAHAAEARARLLAGERPLVSSGRSGNAG